MRKSATAFEQAPTAKTGKRHHVDLPIAAWCDWISEEPASRLELGYIDPMLRRRLSHLDRIALHTAHQCVPENTAIRVIFASRHGELARSAALIAEIANQDIPSPAGFNMSVLNTVPAVFSMARSDKTASTAISGGEETFPVALMEAWSQLQDCSSERVLLIYADDAPPEVYAPLIGPSVPARALAIYLDANEARFWVRCRWQPAHSSATALGAVDSFVGCLESTNEYCWNGLGHAWSWQKIR